MFTFLAELFSGVPELEPCPGCSRVLGSKDIGAVPAQAELDPGAGVHKIEVPDDAANRDVLERAQIRGPAFLLLRPDGHVGLAGTRLEADALMRYFAERHIRLQADPGKVTPLRLRAA